MQGSLFPNGVLVDCAALSRTELTKAAEILRNRADWTCRGIHSGGVVTPNGVTPTKIDVAQLSGFCPNGEYIETTQDYTLIELDDDTAGVDNYVCAVYTEVNDRNQPHETDGLTYPTRSSMAYRIRVYSETNYLALSDTDDNLSNDARDRMLLLAIVNANGAGMSITTSDITLPTEYNNLMYAVPSDLHTITGVTITGVSSGTEMGTGTVDYTYVAGPTYSLTWTSPTGGIGAVVNPTVDGSYTLSDGAGEYIVVEVVISQLPLTTPHTENVEIYNLYYQQIPRQSAEDFLHRNMIGSGIITPTNPHGLSYDDLYGSDASLLQQHRDVDHCNGIWRGSSVNIFFPGILTTAGGDTFTLVAPAAGDLYFINGKKLDSISQTSIQFIPANVPASASGTHFFEVYVTDTGDLEVLNDTNQPKASYPAVRTMTGTWIADMSPSYPAGAYLFSDTVVGNVHTFQWDGGQEVVVDTATDPSQMIRLYDESGVNWVDIWFNAAGGSVNADANPPGVGVHNDTITVYDSPDWDQNMQIYSLIGWYDAAAGPAKFKIGTSPYDVVGTRSVIDKKPWGTLCVENMADEALQQLNYHPLDELHFSGVLLRRNGDYNEFEFSNTGAPSAVVSITGGDYYCRGRRLTFAGDSVTLAGASKRYLFYIDWNETLQYLNVTDDFASDLGDAMRYVLGSTKYIPDVLEDIHETDEFDPPERGVLLYIVDTDATPIVDDYIDMRRNVNGPVDPWSVADFVYSADAVSAAFDNLYSAFAYADYYRSYTPKFTDGLTITVVGETTLDRVVNQYYGIKVVGSKGTGANSLVNCTYGSLTGAWILRDGCTVSDLNLNIATTGVLFWLAGDNCSIERCMYTNTGAANVDWVVYYGVARNGFRFVGNDVRTSGGVFYNLLVPTFTSENFTVSDNIVVQNSVYSDSFLLRIVGLKNTIRNNTVQSLTSAGSSFYTHGINLFASYSTVVCGNDITIGGRDGTVTSAGICYDMSGTDDYLGSVISDNKISIEATSTSDVDVGVYVVDGCNGLVIKDNVIKSCGVGISVGGYYRDLSISGNQIYDSKYRGIYIITTRMTNSVLYELSIDNNIIDTMTSGTVVGVGWGINLRGVDVVIGGVHDTILRHFCITNNKISSIVNTVALGDAIGVYIDIQAGDRQINDQVTIKDNNISGLVGHSTGTTAGIELYQTTSNISDTYTSAVDGNQVSIVSFTAGPVGAVRGIYINAYNFDDCSISNNVVLISGATSNLFGSGIIINPLSPSNKLKVVSNLVESLWDGIFINCDRALVSNNSITCGSIGIACLAFSYSKVSGNIIKVFSNNDNPYNVDGIGSVYNHCIAVHGSSNYFDISNNFLELRGDQALGNIKAGAAVNDSSSNIWVYGSVSFSIVGNTCKQYYSAKVGVSFPSHIYCCFDDAYLFDIKDNTIDNHVGLAASLSNGIYIDNINFAGIPVYPNGHVHGNTIYCTIPESSAGPVTWEGTPPPFPPATTVPYELFMLDSAGIGVSSERVMFTGNLLIMDNSMGVMMPQVYIATLSAAGPPWRGRGSASNLTNFATGFAAGTGWW